MLQSQSVGCVEFDPTLVIVTLHASNDQKVFWSRERRYLSRTNQEALLFVIPGHDSLSISEIDLSIEFKDSQCARGTNRCDHLIVTSARLVPESDLIDRLSCELKIVITLDFILRWHDISSVFIKVNGTDNFLIAINYDSILVKDKHIVIGAIWKIKEMLTFNPVTERILPIASDTILCIQGRTRLILAHNYDTILKERFLFIW